MQQPVGSGFGATSTAATQLWKISEALLQSHAD